MADNGGAEAAGVPDAAGGGWASDASGSDGWEDVHHHNSDGSSGDDDGSDDSEGEGGGGGGGGGAHAMVAMAVCVDLARAALGSADLVSPAHGQRPVLTLVKAKPVVPTCHRCMATRVTAL